MGAASWAIPVGVLTGIVVLGFAFIWYWFPKTWQRGVNDEARIIEEANGGNNAETRAANWARARETIRLAEERAEKRKRGEVVDYGELTLERDGEGRVRMPAGRAGDVI